MPCLVETCLMTLRRHLKKLAAMLWQLWANFDQKKTYMLIWLGELKILTTLLKKNQRKNTDDRHDKSMQG